MSDTRVDFSAPAELRKWPSLNNERVSASLGARPYLISEGTLDECIQQFMELREGQRHLYEFTPRRSLMWSARSCRRNTSSSWRGSEIFSENNAAHLAGIVAGRALRPFQALPNSQAALQYPHARAYPRRSGDRHDC
jgi:hypothetical protein